MKSCELWPVPLIKWNSLYAAVLSAPKLKNWQALYYQYLDRKSHSIDLFLSYAIVWGFVLANFMVGTKRSLFMVTRWNAYNIAKQQSSA